VLLTEEELEKIRLLGADLSALWEASTTTNRDRKRLLRCLIEEVQLRTEEGRYAIRIIWKGGALSERELTRGKPGWAQRTAEDTVELVRTLAREFDDAQIARVLNKQGRRSGLDNPFNEAKRHLTARQAWHPQVFQGPGQGSHRGSLHSR